MKYLLLICDGMADEPYSETDGLTPLEYAFTPGLDALAGMGATGMLSTSYPGRYPGTETALPAILGYDPEDIPSGRGWHEYQWLRRSMPHLFDAEIMERKPVMVARGTLLSIDREGIVSDVATRGSLSEERATQIACILEDYFKNRANSGIIRTGETKYLLPLYIDSYTGSDNVAAMMSRLSAEECVGLRLEDILSSLPGDCKTVRCIREIITDSHRLLGDMTLYPWSMGGACQIQPFGGYAGYGAMVTATPFVAGFCDSAGMDVTVPNGCTGDIHTDYGGKLRAALSALKTHDFAAIHVEACDEAAHRRDLEGKIRAIEAIDREIVSPMVRWLREGERDLSVAVTPDHPTVARTGRHGNQPVPFLICGNTPKDHTAVYGEREASAGCMGIVDARALITLWRGIATQQHLSHQSQFHTVTFRCQPKQLTKQDSHEAYIQT